MGTKPPALYSVAYLNPQMFSSVLMEEPAPFKVDPLAWDSHFPSPYASQVPSPQSSRFPPSYMRTLASLMTSEVLHNHTMHLTPLPVSPLTLTPCLDAWCNSCDVNIVGAMFSKHTSQVPSPQLSRFPLLYVCTLACSVTSEVLDDHTMHL